MTQELSELLSKENLVLKRQLEEAQDFILGFNPGLRLPQTAKIYETDIYCNKSDALSVIMKLIAPSEKCLQLGGPSPSISIAPLYGSCIYASPYIQECLSSPLLNHFIGMRINELDLLHRLPNNAVDSIVIFNPLRFLAKNEIDTFLKEAIRVASSQVIVSNIFFDRINSAYESQYANDIDSPNLSEFWQNDFYYDAKVVFSDMQNEHYCAFITPKKNTKNFENRNGRLILMTESNDSQLNLLPNDLIICDVSLIGSIQERGQNIRPMFLSVLAKNLDMKNYQLRRSIANYDLLEAYFDGFGDVIACGYEASLIAQYFKDQSKK